MLLREGFSTTIAIAGVNNGPGVTFAEIELTTPSVETKEIMQTTQRNSRVQTKWPALLYDTGKCTVKVAYDPLAYNAILAIMTLEINRVRNFTVTFPNSGTPSAPMFKTISFYAFLSSFKPDAMKEGERPTAEIEITLTNMNPNATNGLTLTELNPALVIG